MKSRHFNRLLMLWNRVISRPFADVVNSRHFGFYNIIKLKSHHFATVCRYCEIASFRVLQYYKVEIASFRDCLPMLKIASFRDHLPILWNRVISVFIILYDWKIASFRDKLPILWNRLISDRLSKLWNCVISRPFANWNRVISRLFADVVKSRYFATVCRCCEIESFRFIIF
jgi:hypothetical protein